MQVSINGTSKEVVAFLVSLSGRYAAVTSAPAPVVAEVVRIPAATCLSVGQVAHMHPDQIRDALADAGTVAINGAVVKAAPEAKPEAEKTEPVDPYPNGVPDPGDAQKEPAPEPTTKPKARKSRLTPIVPVAGEAKPDAAVGAGADEAKPEPVADTAKPETTPETASKSGVIPENLLPLGWATWSVAKRRVWAQTQPGLSANERFVLLQANPVAEGSGAAVEGKPEPVTETKPEPVTEPDKTEPAAGAEDGVDCPLPPTWEAWSLPKKIMWATMRSAGETATLLKQFGFADKIGPVNAENLFQVRRKLEIAMRMEAQGK